MSKILTIQTAPPPPAEKLPPWALDPEAVKARAKVAGSWEPVTVATNLMQNELSGELRWIDAFAGETADKVRNQLVAGESLKRDAGLKLTTFAGKAHELQEAVIGRADLKGKVANLRAQLETTKGILGDPACLGRQDSELLRLHLQGAHLPKEIAAIEAEIATATKRIEVLLEETDIDPRKFLASIIKSAKGDGNREADSRVMGLHRAGHLTI